MGIWEAGGEFPGRRDGGEDLVEEIVGGEGRGMEMGGLKVVLVVVELGVVGVRRAVTAVAMEVGEGVGESHISPVKFR